MPKPDPTLAAFRGNVARLPTERGLSQEQLGQTYIRSVEGFLAQLDMEIGWNEEESIARFSCGGNCGRCTDSALRVAHHFHGRVYGFSARANRAALLNASCADGHDFALLRGRFIVDWWAHRWARVVDRAVFDLRREADLHRVITLYGDPESWERVPLSAF